MTLGQVRQDGQWSTTRVTRSYSQLWDAARAVAELYLQLTTVLAVRVPTGTKELKARSEFSSSFLIWWIGNRSSAWQTLDSTETGADLKFHVGSEWPNATAIQFLMGTTEDEHAVAPVAEPPQLEGSGTAHTGTRPDV